MKRVLLDTHAFLWFIADDPRLGKRAAKTMERTGQTLLLSVASLWEMAIKQQLGKLRLTDSFEDFVRTYVTETDIEVLPIEIPHLTRYSTLPLHHRDPFDRLIIAQAVQLRCPVISGDGSFSAYDVDVIW